MSCSWLNIWRCCRDWGSKGCCTAAVADAFPAKVLCQSLFSSQDAQASSTCLWWTLVIVECPWTVISGVPLGCIIVFICVRATSNVPGESIRSTRPPSAMCEPRCDKPDDGTSSQNIRSSDVIKFILNLTNLSGVINNPVMHGCISRCCFRFVWVYLLKTPTFGNLCLHWNNKVCNTQSGILRSRDCIGYMTEAPAVGKQTVTSKPCPCTP